MFLQHRQQLAIQLVAVPVLVLHVNTGTTPKVQYGYANGSSNTTRPTSIIYPDGRAITYSYGTANGINDAASRIESIVDDDVSSTHLADYSYLGGKLGGAGNTPTLTSWQTQGAAVEVDYTEPDVKYTLVGTAGGNDPDTGDIYLGWDRFGRVKDNYWYDYGSATDVGRIKYGYDRAGNRIWRENTVAASYGKYFDELYAYDLIHRLKHMDRGSLDSGHSTLDHLQFAQCWKLDETGNWSNFREDDDGDSSWDLVQNRTNNKVNEITDITETTGPSWVTPVYSKAGNMTTVPKPADPTASFTATYDAWNRLVKIEEGDDTVAEYEYDGAKRRVIKKVYSGGVLDETRHMYYTEPARWQVVEERVDASTDPDRQFVWGLRYIDDIVLRDRDTTGDGSLDERLYGMQDANWNVTGICDSGGSVQERYAYSSYGVPCVLTAAFVSRAGSNYDWETQSAGYRFDSTCGLYQVRARQYHPLLGLWEQRDPLGLSSGVNAYEYVGGNPTNWTDPLGTVVDPLSAGIAGLVVLCVAGMTYSDITQLLSDIQDGNPIDPIQVHCGRLTGCLAAACAALTATSISTQQYGVAIALGFLCSGLIMGLCEHCTDMGCRPAICG